jgi:hypothetical protein
MPKRKPGSTTNSSDVSPRANRILLYGRRFSQPGQPRPQQQHPAGQLGHPQPSARRLGPDASEADQAVPPDPAQMALADQVGQLRQRPQRRVISGGAHPDELAVGAMHLARRIGTHWSNAPSSSVSELNTRPARTWSRTIATWRSTRPFPVGRSAASTSTTNP